MKKTILVCSMVLAAVALVFVGCEAKSCKCTYNDGDDKVSTTVDNQALSLLRAAFPDAKLTTCLDLQNFYRENAKVIDVSAEAARTVTCR